MSDHDLYVFDLDGTLVDTLPDITRAVNAALVEGGWPARLAHEVRGFLGDGARDLIHRATGGRADEAALDRLVERYRAHYRQHLVDETRLYDGVLATLGRLGAPAAVLTNKPGPEARAILAALGLGSAFTEIIGDGDGLPRKPDPTALRAIVERAGARRAVYVGDSAVDEEVARRAGVAFVHAAFGYGVVDVGPRRIGRFEELIAGLG